MNVCARRERKLSLLGLCRAAKGLLKTNICARRERKLSLFGLCRVSYELKHVTEKYKFGVLYSPKKYFCCANPLLVTFSRFFILEFSIFH